ncbi:MAG: FliH/SctL family protein [bacterium]|nr:FliH/SctL family protein [bacterium]
MGLIKRRKNTPVQAEPDQLEIGFKTESKAGQRAFRSSSILSSHSARVTGNKIVVPRVIVERRTRGSRSAYEMDLPNDDDHLINESGEDDGYSTMMDARGEQVLVSKEIDDELDPYDLNDNGIPDDIEYAVSESLASDSEDVAELKLDNVAGKRGLKSKKPANEAGVSNAEIDRIKKAAFEDGRQEGYQEGYEKGGADAQLQVAEHAQEIFNVINDIIGEKERIFKSAEMAVLDLAVDVAKRIVQTELSQSEAALINVVTEAMVKISDTNKVIIRLNRNDAPRLQEHLDFFKAKLPGVNTVLIQEDMTVSEGGCVLETDFGFVDAQMETKLSFIETALKQSQLKE